MPSKYTPNTVRIVGNVACIALTNRAGDVIAESVIDAADVPHALTRRWALDHTGYAVSTRERNGRSNKVSLHRFLLGCKKSDGAVVDHINRDKLDNRRCNLRIVDHVANSGNRDRKVTSRYPGVTWNKGTGRWLAQGVSNGKRYFLGRYESEIEAAQAYLKWRDREGLPQLADPTGDLRHAMDWAPTVRDYNRYTSKYIGVGYCKQTGKWKVQLMHEGKQVWLGRHATEEEAAAVAAEWLNAHGRPTLRAVDALKR